MNGLAIAEDQPVNRIRQMSIERNEKNYSCRLNKVISMFLIYMEGIPYVLTHVKKYWYVISGEILNWYGPFCCWIVNILHNTQSISFFQIKVFCKSPKTQELNFQFQYRKENRLFYPDYVATNYREVQTDLIPNHCWVQICKLRHVSN